MQHVPRKAAQQTMALILELKSGSQAGQSTRLIIGQVLHVGRTEQAELAVPEDGHMSASHFLLECGTGGCGIRDLGSTNGTFVNGQRISSAMLSDGDTIVAGQTTFAVRIETDRPEDTSAGEAESVQTPAASEAVAPPAPDVPGGGVGGPFVAPAPQGPSAAESGRGLKSPADGPLLKGVVLEVRSGTSMGRKTWLHPGGSVTVGRTELADFVLAEDGRLSGRHFALSCGVQACRLRDLESANGTFLNGQNVEEETDLYDGDEIQAGQTTFVVRVRGGPPRPTDRLAPGAMRPSGALLPDGSPATALPEEALEYEEVRCPSGLVLLRGTASELDPAVIGRRLSLLMPLYLIVDFEKLARPLPDGLSEPVYLFDWLPEQVARDCSPVILGPAEEDAQFSLVGEAWGRDSLTCVYSKRDKPSLFQHLREIASGKKASGGRTQGQVLGHCWPSVVMQAFANGSPDFVAHVFSALDAAMLEVHGGERWGLFCQTGMAGTLQGVGFRPAGG